MGCLLSVPVQKNLFLSNVSVFWPRFDSAYKVRGLEVSEMAYFRDCTRKNSKEL